MKRFLEKHDLIKLVGFFGLLAVLFSWICTYSYYYAGELVTDADAVGLGLFDITTYGLVGFYYFTMAFMFLFVVAGFYKFLGSVVAYQTLTDKIANKFMDNKKVFVGIAGFIIAVLTSLVNDYFLIIAIIPFFISVLSKLKVDKVTGVATTFGSMLIGILGATYSVKIVGELVNTSTGYGLTYGFELVSTIILLAISYLLLMSFIFTKMGDETKEKDILVDFFGSEQKEVLEIKTAKAKKVQIKKSVSTLPLVIALCLSVILVFLGSIDWETSFGITVFKDFHNDLINATVFGAPIYKYILGSQAFMQLGSWDLFSACTIMFVLIFVIKILYRVPFDQIIDEFGEGIKKFVKPFAVLFAVFAVLIISASSPALPGLMSRILDSGTNIFTMFITSFITSFFAIDFHYLMVLIGGAFSNFENLNVAGLIVQSAYGVFGLLAPTSAILILGLSLTNTKFTEWLKFIWKFALALVVVIFVILAIVMYL